MTQAKAERLHNLYAGLTASAVRDGDWQAASAYALMVERVSPFASGPIDDLEEVDPLEPSAEWLALCEAIDGEPTPDDIGGIIDDRKDDCDL